MSLVFLYVLLLQVELGKEPTLVDNGTKHGDVARRDIEEEPAFGGY
jgi:hypothetical protein